MHITPARTSTHRQPMQKPFTRKWYIQKLLKKQGLIQFSTFRMFVLLQPENNVIDLINKILFSILP